MSGVTAVVAASFVRRHFWMILAVVAGTALRLITMATYRPAFMFFGDSYAHLIYAQRVTPRHCVRDFEVSGRHGQIRLPARQRSLHHRVRH